MTVGVSTASIPELLAGRYRVLGAVGRGAIAEVVRARDERTGAEVALKILYPHLRESAAVVERFRREVAIVRRIAAPHVLAIHEVVDSDEQLFLVMDYHPGGDLADRLARKGRLEASEVRDLAAQLCGALAAAHRAGVVHRDVKPSNVLCGAGAQLDVRLCDFGLARSAELSGLTTANAVLGTPEYMAPEVVTEGHADPRSDIYSLGIVLFEAATGRLPFYGDSPYQLMRQHVDIEAPRARSLAPELPSVIDAAIACALAKDPLDRFATVEDLVYALADDSQQTALVSPALTVPVRRACRRCGGWVVDDAGVCADCGRIMLRLDYQSDGVSVIVTGPGQVADKVDAPMQVALYKLLDELPTGSVTIPRRGRRAPRVPFYIAKGIAHDSAKALVERLHAIGLTAVVGEHEKALVKKAMRQKVWQMTCRPLAGFGFLFQQGSNLIPRVWPAWARIMTFALIAAGGVTSLALALVNCKRPIVERPRKNDGATNAGRRLAALLGRLASRQDRRLVAHVLERLGQSEALGQAEPARAIADRAAEAGAALVVFDQRRSAGASVSADPAGALEELRREEMMRVVVRADLLRAVSWLDRLCLGVARANAARAADVAGEVQREIETIGREVDAAGEVAKLLADRR